MHQIAFSRLAAASILSLSLTACGGDSGDASLASDADGASGSVLKSGGLQRGDDLASTASVSPSAAATSTASAQSATRAGGLKRGDETSSSTVTANAASVSSVPVSMMSAQESSAVGMSTTTAPAAPAAAATPSIASGGMKSGDSANDMSVTASAAPVTSSVTPAAVSAIAGAGLQRGDETPVVAAPAPAPAAASTGAAAISAAATTTAVVAAASAPAAAAVPAVTTSAAPTAPPVSYRRKVPMSGPVAVPANFTGIHSHYWPGPAPAPTYDYGTVRSLNYYGDYETLGILWYGINTADGVYNWAKMDNWVNTHHAAGKQIIYSLYGTPEWCASNTGIRDLYNRAGGDSKPASLTCVQKFVDALVRRYNGDGVRRIQKLEIWNEPNFQGYAYWRNSAADLAALGRTVYQTAKAADAGIQILWPAFVEWYSGPVVWADNVEYANASDGAGGTGKQWADAFAFHFYAYNTGMDDLMDNQESAIKTLAAIGRPNLDRHNTEMGFGDGYGETLSTAVKATTIKRWMALSAAYGNKVAALYAHESGHLGAPAYTAEISTAINELHQKLAGKTIREAGVLQDGRVFIVFGDNSTWLI